MNHSLAKQTLQASSAGEWNLNNKRVLVDGYNLGLARGTGIATYARNLVATLRAQGCEVSCLYDRAAKRGSKHELLNEIRFFDQEPPFVTHVDKTFHVLWQAVRSLKLALNPLRPLRPIEIRIKRHVVTEEFAATLPQAQHFYSYDNLYHLAYVYFYLTGRFLRIHVPDIDIAHWTFAVPIEAVGARNIYTIHDIIPIRLPYTTRDNKALYHRLLGKIAERADTISTVSMFSLRDIAKTYAQAAPKLVNTYQAVQLPENLTGIPESQVAELLKSAFDLEYKNYYLMVGAFEPKKNHGRLIDAFLASGIRAPLVIVGPDGWRMEGLMGSYDEALHQRVHLKARKFKVEDRVMRIGYVRFAMLINLIRGAKVLCFPSLYEGFGLPVLEAMSLGTPVLCSNTSSLPEVGGDAAIYVDPYDVQDISEKLRWCEDNTGELNAHSERGRLQAAQFSAERYARALEQLYARNSQAPLAEPATATGLTD